MNWWVLKRKIHISWLISICSLCFSLGVYISGSVYSSDIALLLIGIVFLIIGLYSKTIGVLVLVIIGSFFIGIYRGSVSGDETIKAKTYYGKVIQISGSIIGDVDINNSGKAIIHLRSTLIDGSNVTLNIWATTNVETVKKGDELIIRGKFSKGFGNYAGKIYDATILKVAKSSEKSYSAAIRDKFTDSIKKSIKSEPESSLGIGYLIGQRQQLPADFILALQAAGLTHVVVASGYNLTILVRLARRIFERVSKYLSALSASAMIICFISITGLSPSMSRAGLVSGLSLLAWYYGRRFHPIVLLSIAIAVTVFINPNYIWGDLGWQLSFAAFAGVLILAPLLTRYFFEDKKINFIGQILIETISAQILTAPLIIASFGQFSNVAIIANLMVLPLVPLAMLLTFISSMCQMIMPALSFIAAFPAKLLLGYMVNVVNFFAELPWAISTLQIGNVGLVLSYMLIIFFCFYLWRVTKYNLRDVNLVE